MPEYTYIDESGHTVTITEPMLTQVTHICAVCGDEMWRKPHAVYVNWAGLAPSSGVLSQPIKDAIEDAPRRRDQEVKHKGKTLLEAERRLANGDKAVLRDS